MLLKRRRNGWIGWHEVYDFERDDLFGVDGVWPPRRAAAARAGGRCDLPPYLSGGVKHDESRRRFFFEKKNQKTFICFLSGGRCHNPCKDSQKFFAELFFKKRPLSIF
jgi:hypothetical protein